MVSAAGDINGDGFADVIIGMSTADPNGKNQSGVSHVVFGHSGVNPAEFELSSLNGTNGFTVNGVSAGDRSGIRVSSAGDVNGDGLDDLFISAINVGVNAPYSGQTYVIFGNTASGPAQFELSAINGVNGFVINGQTQNDFSGESISNAGDVNGDGVDDLIIGSQGAEITYVVFGQTNFGSAALELSDLDGSNGFKIHDKSGRVVSDTGDINGDGLADLLIGDSNAAYNGTRSGATFVVFGQTSGISDFELSDLNGTNGFQVRGISPYDDSGGIVSGAGDINGDGYDDLLTQANGQR